MSKKKSGGGAFAVAQQIGKSLFLPIAVLPAAGLLLGIGSSFTNETTIATYGLTEVLHPGTVLYSIMQFLKEAGNAIFANLSLIFALAVALGMAKKEKGVAVLSAGVFYLVMLTTVNVCLQLDGQIVDGVIQDGVKQGAIAEVLGIQTLQMGVFGGILAGLLTAVLCNRFYKTKLPNALSFFAGTRFVPIISMVGGILTGLLMFLVWPIIQNGIYALGELVQSAGYFGTFIYGVIERALIPFGLHHIFYMPFWQTGVGGSMMIDGTMVEGAQNIFFAQLASPETTKFSIESTRFLVGKYPFMMGGLPGAALAMYTCAKPEKRKMAGSLLLSAAITSFVTGVTEPLEFTFLFLAPVLYGIHVVLAGISFAVCHILEICVGTTFSDGLIDLILYGVLPGQDKSNWMALIPVIIIYFIIYFLIFRTFILKMNLKTVGREDDDEEMHLVTKDEYRKATGVGVASSEKGKKASASDEKSALIVKGVGGLDNLDDIDCCATRLRLTLKDTGKVSEAVLKSTGASGVVIKGSGIQVIYGPSVTLVKSDLEEYVEKVKSGEIVVEEPVQEPVEKVEPKEEVQKPKMKDAKYHAHMNGTMKLMCEVEDETFARKILGDGIAVEPSEGKLFAPCNGTVAMVFDTKHAVVIESEEGSQILLHIGIDTVKLQGQHFEAHVSAGQEVKQGDLLVEFDMDAIKAEGYKLTTPMIINNTDEYKEINPIKTGNVSKDDEILEVIG